VVKVVVEAVVLALVAGATLALAGDMDDESPLEPHATIPAVSATVVNVPSNALVVRCMPSPLQ
jgi:hypothetical protein